MRFALLICVALFLPSGLCAQPLQDARAALEAGQAQVALTQLQAISEEDVKDPDELRFLTALAALEAGELSLAISMLETFVRENPSLIRPRLELARAYFLARNDENAAAQIRLVLTADVPPPVRQKLVAMLAQIEDRRSGYFRLSFALSPDSNANAATSATEVTFTTHGGNFVLSEDARAQSSWGVNLRLEAGRYFPVGDAGLQQLFVHGSISSNDYAAIGFDDFRGNLYAGYRWRHGDRITGIGPTFERRFYGGKSYSSAKGLRAVQTIERGAGSQDDLSLAYNRHRFDESAQSAESLSLQWGRLWGLSSRSSLRGTLGASWNEADNGSDSRRGVFAQIKYYQETGGGWSYSIAPQLIYDRFNLPKSIYADERREDLTANFNVILRNRRLRFAGFQPELRLTQTWRSSVVEFFEYERTRLSIGATRNF